MASNEIICISSDEEDEPPQKYAWNKQTAQSEKHVQTRQEIVDNMDESVYRPKRKASQMENNNTTSTTQEKFYDKKMRLCMDHVQPLYVCDEVHVDVTNVVDKKPNIEEKPKLIVKEKVSVSDAEQDTFPMFISLCLQKDKGDDMKTIVNKLKRRYEQLDPAYVSSEEFINFLNEKRNVIMRTSNKLYVHICEVMNEMKSKSKHRSYLHNNINMANGKECDTAAAHSDNTRVASVSSSNRGNSATNIDSENYDTESTDNDKKVKLIIRTMAKCERVIKKLEEEEVSFVEENDSSYMKLEKYKHRMVELYNKLCEYTGDNPDAGRPYLRPKHFSTTRIVAVDQAITSFINSNLSKRKHLKKIGAFADGLIFPDYRDILECVKRCNDSHNLGLDKKKQLQIAKEAFTELGQHLQRVRRDDYWDTFSLNLENKAEDPAVKDKDLAVKLSENRKIGNERLAQVFEEFTKKQQEMNNRPEDGRNTSEDEEEGSSAEDENKLSNHSFSDSDSQGDASTDEEKSVKKFGSVDMVTDTEDKERQEVEQNKARAAESIPEDDNKNTAGNDTNTLHGEYVRITQSTNSLEVVEVIEDKDTEINKVTAQDKTMYMSTSTKPALVIRPEKTVKTSTTPTSTKETEDDVADIVSENLKLHERIEEKQPALRVCSFAKSPTTWDDSQQKIGKPEQAALTVKQVSHIEQGKETTDVIDLTKEISNQGVKLGTVQFRNAIVSVNGKYKTLRLPANVANSINCLKNIKCTKLTKATGSNIQNAQVVSTLQRLVSISGGSTIIAIPTMTIASPTLLKTAGSISTTKLSRTPIVTSSIQPNTSSNAGNTKQITAAKNIQQTQKAIYVQLLKKTDTNDKSKDPNKLNSKSC